VSGKDSTMGHGNKRKIMYKVLIADKIPDSALNLLQSNKKYHIDIKTGLRETELIKLIPGYHAIIVRSATTISSKVIKVADNLKVIGRAGTGLDNIDVISANKHGIAILNTPGSNSQAVAELTIGLIYCLARNLYHAFETLKNRQWNKSQFMGIEIKNKTLGLIGFGKIGQKVGEMAASLGMRIQVNKNQPLRRSPGYEFEMTSFDKLLEKSDFVSLHLPKTNQTSQLIGMPELQKMKSSAFILNCARGGILNENDLLKALNEDIIAGAALDVFEHEPPEDFQLINHPKVIAVPHIGGATFESQERVGQDIVESLMEFLETKYVFI
jgi:D-3-phosphoglycerate dehydrogenase